MNIEKFRGYEDFEANPTVKKNTDNTKNDTENVGEHVDASRNTAEKPEQDKERTLLREQQKNRLDTLRTVEAQQNSLDR